MQSLRSGRAVGQTEFPEIVAVRSAEHLKAFVEKAVGELRQEKRQVTQTRTAARQHTEQVGASAEPFVDGRTQSQRDRTKTTATHQHRDHETTTEK